LSSEYSSNMSEIIRLKMSLGEQYLYRHCLTEMLEEQT